MKTYIADSCFWFGLLDNRDAYYETANRIFNRLRTDSVFLIPDPFADRSKINEKLYDNFVK